MPSATLCIHVPVDETNDDVIASAKLRCRSGANDANAIATQPTGLGENSIYSSSGDSSLSCRGRRANHHTETMVANAPSTPMLDLTALPLLFSATSPSY